jgi:hypothetical protein
MPVRAFTRMKALADKTQFLPAKGMKRGGVGVVGGGEDRDPNPPPPGFVILPHTTFL